MHDVGRVTVILWSVSAMTPERRRRIGRALDAHPVLRPDRVGGDPPQIRVGETIADLLAGTDLPIQWCGGTAHPRRDDSCWFLDLHEQWYVQDGPYGDEIARAGSDLSIHLTPARVALAGGAEAVLEGTSALADAMGASFGCAYPDALYGQLDDWYADVANARPHPRAGLATVHWWQYFGPAFLARHPGLADLEGSVMTPEGGVSYWATETPEESLHPSEYPTAGDWRRPLVDLLGEAAFVAGSLDDITSLPSEDEHASYDPDAAPPPPDLLERLAAAARDQEERRAAEHSRGSARRRRLEGRRGPVGPVKADAEWSENVDGDDVPGILKNLRAVLGIQVTGHYAGALSREISNAPPGDEGSVDLSSEHGPFSLGWYVDEVDSVVISVLGPLAVIDAVRESRD